MNADGDSTRKEIEVATDRVEHGEDRKKDGEREIWSVYREPNSRSGGLEIISILEDIVGLA